MTSSAQPLPLASIRVIELGNFIAAPTAGRLLADFGAEVIKVERPRHGDEIRSWRLYSGTTSMLYRTINRNKKSIVLDLRTEEGQRAVLDLAKVSDVVLENFRPGTLERWGIGPEALSEANPDIILTRISAFGQNGPMGPRPGFAAIAEAYGGLRHIVGYPDRPSVRVGVSIGDTVAGLYAAFGAMMALYSRVSNAPTSLPLDHRVIDVALNEAVLSLMESLLPDFSAYGVERERIGGRTDGVAPSNSYECADGTSIVIAGNADQIFRRLMLVIGREDLADDPGLQTNPERWDRREEVDAAIGAWAALHTPESALAILDSVDVPSGPVYTATDVIDDPQFNSRGMVQRLSVSTGDEDLDNIAFPGIVPVLGGSSLPIRSLGPDLGVHTREILEGLLGWSSEDVSRLLKEYRMEEF